jgi:hypothetical protein
MSQARFELAPVGRVESPLTGMASAPKQLDVKPVWGHT